MMLPGYMRETIDDPSGLVITTISVGRIATCLGISRRDLRYQRQIRVVDCSENVLPPCHQVAPDADVVPEIRESLSPSLQDAFELCRALFESASIGYLESGEDCGGFVKLDELLEVLQQRDMRHRNHG